MPQTYLRFVPTATFGLIASPGCRIALDANGRIAFSAAAEDVLVWNLKLGVQLARLHVKDNRSAVTHLQLSPNGSLIALGYEDGCIRLFNTLNYQLKVVLNGHRSAVTALTFDESGVRLVSGSKDTDVVMWDLLTETGLYRLRGHKNAVSQIRFLTSSHLLTSSKDTTLKLWDLDTQYCYETVVGHRHEINDFDILREVGEDIASIWTVSADADVHIWHVNLNTLGLQSRASTSTPIAEGAAAGNGKDEEEKEEVTDAAPGAISDPSGWHDFAPAHTTSVSMGGAKGQHLQYAYSLPRHFKQYRATQITIRDRLCLIATNNKGCEALRILTKDEIAQKAAKRLKRQKKSRPQDSAVATLAAAFASLESEDYVQRALQLRCPAKIRSLVLSTDGDPKKWKIVLATSNNALLSYTVTRQKNEYSDELIASHDAAGHGSEIRCAELNDQDDMLVTCSSDGTKIWGIPSLMPIRTLSPPEADHGSVLYRPHAVLFLPGSRYLLVATSYGQLDLYHLPSSTRIRSFAAHNGAVKSVVLRPDGRGCLSGGADGEIKEWDFEVHRPSAATDSSAPAATSEEHLFTLIHVRTLKVDEEVTALAYSKNGSLIIAALMDASVRVFHHDTLALQSHLYGHRLPVYSIDTSDDGELLITGSEDRNIKIWGIMFGECRKSLRCQQAITSVRFMRDTHLFWSVDRDGLIRSWDADKFVNVQNLKGPGAETWSLCVAKSGSFLVTASFEKSIRMFGKTNDQLFLEEERENELNEVIDETLHDTNAQETRDSTIGTVAEAEKQTKQSMQSGEQLIEAIALWQAEVNAEQAWTEHGRRGPPPQPHLLIQYSESGHRDSYVLSCFKRVSAAQLDQALTLLPFALVSSLSAILQIWAANGWEIALTLKIVSRLMDLFYHQFRSDERLIATLMALQKQLQLRVGADRDMIAFNAAALSMLSRMWSATHESTFTIDDLALSVQLKGQSVATGHVIGAKKRKNKKRGQYIAEKEQDTTLQ